LMYMGFSVQWEFNIEKVFSKHPVVMFAQLRANKAIKQSGVLALLSTLNIPLLFVDSELHPVQITASCITLLGQVLIQEENDKAYND
ncbi:ABC transporter substrate-binding protein, partial [Erwinia amylovora]|nr:ABC transporter substrate-binding protein [Erwinia amylovora]